LAAISRRLAAGMTSPFHTPTPILYRRSVTIVCHRFYRSKLLECIALAGNFGILVPKLQVFGVFHQRDLRRHLLSASASFEPSAYKPFGQQMLLRKKVKYVTREVLKL
jgi:hypothetical protein